MTAFLQLHLDVYHMHHITCTYHISTRLRLNGNNDNTTNHSCRTTAVPLYQTFSLPLTPVWSEEVYNSLRCIWQENGPVEAESHRQQQCGHHHPVDFLKAAHSSTDGQGCHHKDSQHARNRQTTLLVEERNKARDDVYA